MNWLHYDPAILSLVIYSAEIHTYSLKSVIRMLIAGIFRIDKNNENEQTETPYSDMDITYKYNVDQKKKDTKHIKCSKTTQLKS